MVVPNQSFTKIPSLTVRIPTEELKYNFVDVVKSLVSVKTTSPRLLPDTLTVAVIVEIFPEADAVNMFPAKLNLLIIFAGPYKKLSLKTLTPLTMDILFSH
jgi:hypothetical protein